MIHYILRRLLLSLPVLLGITLLIFVVIHLSPGSPVNMMMQMNAKVSPETLERFKVLYGLDRPLPVQYLLWLKRVVTGDFGESLMDMRPVGEKIWERLPATLELNLLSLAILFAVAVPMGILSAARQNTPFDRTFTLAAFIGYSLPTFWLALLLMYFFGVKLDWLPISGMRSLNAEYMPWAARLGDHLKHLVLPLFVSAFGGFAVMSRYMRSSMLEVLRQDYIRTARAKGLPERLVLGRHALRNALMPVITLVGLSIPGLIGGSVIFETIFSWPGLGRLAYEATMSYDYPVVMAVTTVGALLTLMGNLLADVMYAVVDPRIRYGSSK